MNISLDNIYIWPGSTLYIPSGKLTPLVPPMGPFYGYFGCPFIVTLCTIFLPREPFTIGILGPWLLPRGPFMVISGTTFLPRGPFMGIWAPGSSQAALLWLFQAFGSTQGALLSIFWTPGSRQRAPLWLFWGPIY